MKFPNFGLAGRIAIVTGASKGLGYGTALALADAGADVVVTSRALERAEPPAAEIRAMDRRALPLALEVCSVDSGEATVEAMMDRLGHIEILVNNAGVHIPHALGYPIAGMIEEAAPAWVPPGLASTSRWCPTASRRR